MTKKHFEAFAVLVRAWPWPEQRARLGAELADLCAAVNPRFDRTRFLKACGVSS
jgi:hypothetical protein